MTSALDWTLATPFQRRVYRALLRVPSGRVVSYGQLARTIGCRSARAIGQALASNPFAPTVPCHRVIAADGTLGGFCHSCRGNERARKRRLLVAEGVRFDEKGRVADPAAWFGETGRQTQP